MTTNTDLSKTNKFIKTKTNIADVDTTNNTVTDNQKKPVRKAGRTLLVKSVSGSSIDSKLFEKLTGLVSHSETKSSSSFFLTFDNIQNALDAYKSLRNVSSDFRIKFSYYRVFFTITGLIDSTDYNQVKQDLISYVTDKSDSTVLYCKLYRKDNKYIGCGDFTIDTIGGMNTILSKEAGLKDFTIGQHTGTFYRYNGTKNKNDESNVHDSFDA